MSVQRVAHVERAQRLIESPSRAALQRFLAGWHEVLHEVKQGADPLSGGCGSVDDLNQNVFAVHGSQAATRLRVVALGRPVRFRSTSMRSAALIRDW